MKKRNYYHWIRSLQLITFVTILCCANNVFSQETDKTESPYFNVFCNDTSAVDFPLLSTNIKTSISGVIADVGIEQVYANSGDSSINATYVFPMSTNAAIYSMQMIVQGRVINAEIKRKDEAQEIFENASDSGYTATLLEQHRPNVFQMSLANINPGDTLKVRMTYTELVEPEKGIYQFVLPSIVGPRFTTNGEDWVVQSINDSLAVANTEWNINLAINAGMPVSANCTSHETSFTNTGNVTYCYLETHPGKDFIVDYTLSGNEIETGLLLYEEEEENFFLSIIQPPKLHVEYDSPKREYVFIMDVSGSMHGEPIDVSKELIINLLNDLNADDKFNILFFAGGSSVFSENSLPVTAGNINAAINMVENMNAGGGTYLLPAMQRAMDMESTDDYSRIFVILTDGYVTVEKEAYELIRENLNEANFFSFGIGSSVNRYIIEGIAYVGEGESFVVTDDYDAYSIAKTFKEYIERPALINIQATFSGINVYDVEPYSIPDVFAERPIIIYGKYDDAESGSVTLTGDYAEGSISSTLNFADYEANANENIALKYLWARKRIKLMSDYGIASNESDTLSIEEEITQLGLKYSLITEFTSFVAVDSNSVVNEISSNEEGGENDGGGLVETDDVENESQNRDTKIIQILGNVTAERILNVKLSGFEKYESDNLILSIVDINGTILIKRELSGYNLENIIPFHIGDLINGLYFVRLSSRDAVVDTAKFMVMK